MSTIWYGLTPRRLNFFQASFDFKAFAEFVKQKPAEEEIKNYYNSNLSIANCAIGQFIQKSLQMSASEVKFVAETSAVINYVFSIQDIDATLYFNLNRGNFLTYGELQEFITYLEAKK